MMMITSGLLVALLTFLRPSLGLQEDDGIEENKIDPGMHLATDHQLVIRSADGQIVMGTKSDDQYKAEARTANNEVKGVYSWLDPRGNPHMVSYNSGINGYQTMPLARSGIPLPQFPYSLYGSPKFPQVPDLQAESRTNPDDDSGLELFLPRSKGKSDDDDDIVVIGPDPDDDYQQDITDEAESEGGATVIEAPEENQQQQITVPIEAFGGLQIVSGTPVAASRPSATAVAGEGGTAHVSPTSQAFVGPGGVAIAFPTAQAAVGPGGIAISRPIAVASAGPGGVAVAGGSSTAFAGLDSSSPNVVYEGQGLSPQNWIMPIVANYYYGIQPFLPQQQQQQHILQQQQRQQVVQRPQFQPQFYYPHSQFQPFMVKPKKTKYTAKPAEPRINPFYYFNPPPMPKTEDINEYSAKSYKELKENGPI